MSFLVTTGRTIKYAWRNITRNVWMGLATVLVLVLALVSVNVLVGVNALIDTAVKTLENRVDISVYFKTETPDAVLQQAQFFMAGLSQVQSVNLLSADQALEVFKQRHAADPKMLEALGELDKNPLGATLVIKAKHTEDYPFLVEALQNPQFGFAIESKTYDDHTEAIRRVRDIGASVRFFGIALITIFGLFSMLIVYNAIRVAIYTQREEIGIMRLVGASGLFVRMPFVLEGLLLALIAVMITTGLVLGMIALIEPHVRTFFDGNDPGLRTFFVSQASFLLLTEGGLLGALVSLSSWAAVGKYLKR